MIDWGKINKLLSPDINIEEVKDKFKEIDIDIIDDDGNFKCWHSIFEGLSDKWDKIS